MVARRWLLAASGIGLLCLSSGLFTPVLADPRAAQTIIQPATPSDKAFIARAFKMRRLAIAYGDQAFGAVIVRDGIIIGQSWSRVILDHDHTAHAEMSTIRDTARSVTGGDLRGAVIYSTSRPCSMCEEAACRAGISKMIHGRKARNAGAPRLCVKQR